MRRSILLLIVALTAGFAPAPLPRSERHPANGFANEVLGHWESGGSKLHITPNRFTHSEDYDYEMKVDRGAKPPAFDLLGIGRQNKGWVFKGIYKVEGDNLILVYNMGETSARPASFESPSRVYKRVGR